MNHFCTSVIFQVIFGTQDSANGEKKPVTPSTDFNQRNREDVNKLFAEPETGG